MARVISICNAKGGVGKTTTAMNLGAYLAVQGKKVLLIDFDPQANASSGLGLDVKNLSHSIYHGLSGAVLPDKLIRPLPIFNFHIIPADANLAAALVELIDVPEREAVLRKFLEPLRHLYNYIFIDLSPSLTLLTVNGLIASDEVLIPIQCEYYSLEGIGQLLETIDLIKNNLGHDLKVNGGLLTMYDKNQKLSREVAREIRRRFPYYVYDVEIPRAVALAEAPSFRKPVILYAPQNHGALAYERLAKEIIEQEFRGLPAANPLTATISPSLDQSPEPTNDQNIDY